MTERVLITGGLGAIGPFVARRFLVAGYEPVIYDYGSDNSLIADMVKEVTVVQGDILDSWKIAHTLRKYSVDRIVHLAALMPDIAQRDPVRGWQVNGAGTLNIFEASRSFDIKRVVFASSKGVYGVLPEIHSAPVYRPINEEVPPRPRGVYAVTKFASEGMAEVYRKNYNLDIIGLRFATTYGPGKSGRHGPFELIPRMIMNAVRGIPMVVERGGEQKNDIIYYRDIAEGAFLACISPGAKSPVYNLGTGRLWILEDIAGALRKLLPGTNIQIGPGLDYYGTGSGGGYCCMDITRAKTELGYEPRYPPEEAVTDFIRMVEKLGLK